MAKQREPSTYRAIHKAADYYEPLFRGRFVRAMKAVQAKTSINDLAMMMGNAKQAKALIPKDQITKALGPSAKVVRDAHNHGGKLGAVQIQKLG